MISPKAFTQNKIRHKSYAAVQNKVSKGYYIWNGYKKLTERLEKEKIYNKLYMQIMEVNEHVSK